MSLESKTFIKILYIFLGNFNQKDIAFTIELLDINDNAPIFDEPKNFQLNSVKENVEIVRLNSSVIKA